MSTLSITEKQSLVRRARSNPLFFHHQILGGPELWDGQLQIFDAVANHQRVAVKAGYNVGKTYCAARVALWWLFTRPSSLVITTAPTHRQIRNLLWGEMRRAHRLARVPLGGELGELRLKLDENWYAIGFSTDDPQNVQGFHSEAVLVIIDEASGVDQEIVESLEGAVSGKDCCLVMFGNPVNSKGAFFDAFKNPLYRKITLSCLDHPNVKEDKEIFKGMVTREWVEERKKRWGEDSPLYVSRVLGEFPKGTSNALIEMSDLEKAQQTPKPPLKDDTVVAGLDIGDKDGDETVFTIRHGARVLAQFCWNDLDLMGTCGEVVKLSNKFGVQRIIGDSCGLGSGVVSRLRELASEGIIKSEVHAYNASASAANTEQHQNKRDEMWYGLAERFRDGDIDLTVLKNAEELYSQLTSINRGKPNSRGQLKAESKDEMKTRVGHSPDRADSLCLAFATPSEARPSIYVG